MTWTTEHQEVYRRLLQSLRATYGFRDPDPMQREVFRRQVYEMCEGWKATPEREQR